jgi:hypothetical protein
LELTVLSSATLEKG